MSMLRRGSLGAKLELSYVYVIIYLFQHVLEGVCLSVFGPACNSTMERMTGEITLLTPSFTHRLCFPFLYSTLYVLSPGSRLQ